MAGNYGYEQLPTVHETRDQDITESVATCLSNSARIKIDIAAGHTRQLLTHKAFSALSTRRSLCDLFHSLIIARTIKKVSRISRA